MPKRKRTSYANKATYKKSRRNSQSISYNNAQLSVYAGSVPRPLGRMQRAYHTYVEKAVSLNPGSAGVATSYVYSANGLYDPNITGVGAQPQGFDQMAALFDHYTVVYSKITVDFFNSDTANSVYCGVRAKDNAASTSNTFNLICGESTGMLLTPQRDAGTVIRSMNVSKFLGRPRILSEDSLRGDISNNPAEQAYWHIYAVPNNTVDMGEILCLVKIDYVTIWTEPKSLNGS